MHGTVNAWLMLSQSQKFLFTVPSWTPCMQIYVHLIQMWYSHDVDAEHVSISPCPHQPGGCNDGTHLAVPILPLSLKSAVQESRMHCKNVLKMKRSKSTVNITHICTMKIWAQNKYCRPSYENTFYVQILETMEKNYWFQNGNIWN